MFESYLKPPISFHTLTGSIVTFNSQYAGLPLKSHTVAVTATQSGSGTPSPDNVRPINGYSAIHIGNISDNTNISYFQGLLNGTYGFVDLGTLNYTYTSGDPTPHFTSTASPLGIKAPATYGTKVVILCTEYNSEKAWSAAFGVAGNDKYIAISASGGLVGISDSDYTNPATFKTAMNGVYLIYELATPTTPSFTNAEFEALCEAFGMNGQSFIINLGGTYYGGEYDARTGVLTVTSVKEVLRGSYFSTYSTSIQCAVGGKPAGWLPWLKQTGGSCEMLSHGLPATRNNIGNISNGCFIGDTTGGNQETIFIKFAGYSSLEDIQALIEAQYNSNTPVEVVYKLATPQTIQLPPCLIDTLEGVNNIWADTGDTTLQYAKFG